MSAAEADYWNFTFDEIGREDLNSMIDKIIATRNLPTDGCSKVTVVAHDSGASQILVAAQDPALGIASKVDKIITVASCLSI